jgi:hypothetical protein
VAERGTGREIVSALDSVDTVPVAAQVAGRRMAEACHRQAAEAAEPGRPVGRSLKAGAEKLQLAVRSSSCHSVGAEGGGPGLFRRSLRVLCRLFHDQHGRGHCLGLGLFRYGKQAHARFLQLALRGHPSSRASS